VTPIETVGMYVFERFFEGAGATMGIPLVTALLVRSSPFASARAAAISIAAIFAFLVVITIKVPDRDLMVESFVVFGLIFPNLVYVFGTCVSALRSYFAVRNDGQEPIR
jgi:hypothetical protein